MPRALAFLRRRTSLVAAALLAGMAAAMAHASFVDSPTVDEFNHLVRGLAFWSGDARLSVAHPPLANALQGIPGHLTGAGDVDFTELRGWEQRDIFPAARSFLDIDYERARSALIAGRLVTALLTLLLGLYLFAFALRWGRLRALAVLALFVFSPVLLAHGHLVTTDLPVAAGFVVAAGEASRYLRSGSWAHLATTCLATTFAVGSKFSGLFLLPSLAFCAAFAAYRSAGFFGGWTARRRALRVVRDGVVISLVVVLAIDASYRFRETGWSVDRVLAQPEPHSHLTAAYGGRALERLSPVALLPGWTPVPVPYTFLFGMATIGAQQGRGHGGRLFGLKAKTPLYFPVMLVIKSTAVLALLAAVALAWAWRRRRAPAPEDLPLYVVPLLLMALLLTSRIQIGVRHALPVVPFAILAAAAVAPALLRLRPRLAAAGAALLAAEVAVAHPWYIGHFSWLIGGRGVGHRVSMIGEDWGQDVDAFGRWARASGIAPLFYGPYNFATVHELEHSGADFEVVNCKGRPELDEPGWLATHAAMFIRRGCGPIPPEARPDLVFQDHIWLFRVPPVNR